MGSENTMNTLHVTLIVGLLVLAVTAAGLPAKESAVVLVEAEGFDDVGGWVVDQQFMDQMGSPMLLAHGMGVPVKDATTTVTFPAAGKYRLWVRTRDWVATWGAAGAPGTFQVLLSGRSAPSSRSRDKPLKTVFGTEGATWHWQDGGTVDVTDTKVALALHDLTGFEGRCDAIVFSADPRFTPPEAADALTALRRKALGLPEKVPDAGEFDFVVVGGGMAGTCAAVAAARTGAKVALIQNRPVLGGNNSSEVRVHLGGKINMPPYPNIGNIVRELDSLKHGNAQPASYYDDGRKLRVVRAEKNIELFLNTHAYKVEKQGDRIVAVIGRNIRTNRELRFPARVVADCTGDGTIGFLAGAEYRMGRESRAETGESLAPQTADRMTMGTSVMWYAMKTDSPAPFPDCPWAVQFDEKTCQQTVHANWNWETGMNKDQVTEFESIRDHAFRVTYGNWAFQKNHSQRKDKYANQKLAWVAYVGGKRESRRLLGDVVLRQQDVVGQRSFTDACVTTTWSIDLHYPDPKNSKQFPGREFRSIAKFNRIKPYAIPYRCLYSRNVSNLLMAGRNISVTHVALGTIRVMRTTGMMGEVIGLAAALCKEHDTTPRGVYKDRLAELKALMTKGFPAPPGAPSAEPPKALPAPAWYKTAGPNLARAAKVTVSGSLDVTKYAVGNINDGRIDVRNNGLRWVSDDQSPQHVELTWAQPQTVAAARIVTGQAGGGRPKTPITDFVLQVRDGSTWKDIPGSKTTGNRLWDVYLKFPPVQTDGLRLVVTDTPAYARIWELELYNPPASP